MVVIIKTQRKARPDCTALVGFVIALGLLKDGAQIDGIFPETTP